MTGCVVLPIDDIQSTKRKGHFFGFIVLGSERHILSVVVAMMVSVGIFYPKENHHVLDVFNAQRPCCCLHQTRRSFCNGQRVIHGIASSCIRYRYPGSPVALAKAFEVESE